MPEIATIRVEVVIIMRQTPRRLVGQLAGFHHDARVWPWAGGTVEAVTQATGRVVRFRETLAETPAPTSRELALLRDRHERTAVAHAG